MVAVRRPLMDTLNELLTALEQDRNSFAASDVMDRAREELLWWRSNTKGIEIALARDENITAAMNLVHTANKR